MIGQGTVYDLDFLANSRWVQALLMAAPPFPPLPALTTPSLAVSTLLGAAFTDGGLVRVDHDPAPFHTIHHAVLQLAQVAPTLAPGDMAVVQLEVDAASGRVGVLLRDAAGALRPAWDDTGLSLGVLATAVVSRTPVQYASIDPVTGRLMRGKVSH